MIRVTMDGEPVNGIETADALLTLAAYNKRKDVRATILRGTFDYELQISVVRRECRNRPARLALLEDTVRGMRRAGVPDSDPRFTQFGAEIAELKEELNL